MERRHKNGVVLGRLGGSVIKCLLRSWFQSPGIKPCSGLSAQWKVCFSPSLCHSPCLCSLACTLPLQINKDQKRKKKRPSPQSHWPPGSCWAAWWKTSEEYRYKAPANNAWNEILQGQEGNPQRHHSCESWLAYESCPKARENLSHAWVPADGANCQAQEVKVGSQMRFSCFFSIF